MFNKYFAITILTIVWVLCSIRFTQYLVSSQDDLYVIFGILIQIFNLYVFGLFLYRLIKGLINGN